MSTSQQQPGVLQVVWYTPGQTGTSGVQEAVKGLEKAEGAEGVEFEGTILEEPGNSVVASKWSSFETGSKASGALATTLNGSHKAISQVAHYKLWDPVSFDHLPECIELVTIQLKSDIAFEDFYREWSAGLKLVTAFDGCPFAALGQGIEDPTTAVQIQPWDTLDAHLVGFKTAPNKPEVMAQLYPIVKKYGAEKDAMKGVHVMLNKSK